MQTFLTLLLVTLLGLLLGILVNYLAEVLPYRRRLVRPFCLSCGKDYELRRYLFYPRRCGECDHPRFRTTWVVEIATALLVLWLWKAPPLQLGFFSGLLLVFYFAVVVVIDMRYRLILHPVSLVGAVLAFFVGLQLHGLTDTLIGGAFGFGLMYGLYLLGGFFARWMARRRGLAEVEDALGFGDVALTGVLGLLLGWPSILAGILLAILLGGLGSLLVVLVLVVTRRYQAMTAIPYGPFLVSGAVLIIFFGKFLATLLGA
jgi:leader peptidase (prepilin peptidase) / N-methyltransferase